MSLETLCSEQLPPLIKFEYDNLPFVSFLKRLEDYALNISLKGRFWIHKQHYLCITKVPILTHSLVPTVSTDDSCISFYWNDPKNLEWWCEFFMMGNKAILKGRNIPVDTTISFIDDEEFTKFRFDSKSDQEFWCEILIKN